MSLNPFKGGKYDLSKTIISALPGGDRASIYTHNQNEQPMAAEPTVTGPVSSYGYIPDGQGGVNYFRGSTPITNAEYAQATGQDTNAIEQQAYQQFQTTSSQNSGSTDQSAGTTGTAADTTPTGDTTTPLPATDPVAPVYSPNFQTYTDATGNTQQYDLNNPDQYKSYINAVNTNSLKSYNDNSKQINDMYNAGLITLDEKLQSLRDNVTSLKKSRDSELSKITGYFNNVAPDVTSSQEGNMKTQTNTDYNTTQAKYGDLFGTQKASEIAGSNLSPYANDLSATGDVARSAQALSTNKTQNTTNNTNTYQNNLNKSADAISNWTAPQDNSGAASINTSIANQVQDYLNNLTPSTSGTTTGMTGSTASSDFWNPDGTPKK